MNSFQEQIYETIDILVNEKMKSLNFDKTEKGEVVSVGSTSLKARINGEIFSCKIKDGDSFNVGDIIYIKTPKNNDYDRYAEAGSVRRFVHIKYSDDGGLTFTGNNGDDEGMWMGLYIGERSKPPVDTVDYKWTRIKGVDGESQRIWIRYSDKEDGGHEDGRDMSTDPAEKMYIGIATTTSHRAPEHPKSYSWSRVKGLDGVKGDNGYVHIKYSDDGGITFTANNGEAVGKWIGIYTDDIKEDSLNPNDYKWNKVVGESERVWIRYSKYKDGGAPDGSEMSTNPRDMGYIGFAYGFREEAPTLPIEYEWSKITGTDGIPGKNGYVHIKYSNDGGNTFTVNDEGVANGETVGKWIGVYTDDIEEDSNDPNRYTWNKVVGESQRVWIRYSNAENGGMEDGSEMSTDPKGKTYIGIATTTKDEPPKNPNSYSWSKIQGTDGVKGENGYVHIKYSNDGGLTFTQPGDGELVGDWIGIYTDEFEHDSLDPKRYKWNKVVGDSERVWIRYSDKENGGAPDGSEMSINPVNKTYVGIAVTKEKTAPVDPRLYSWSKIQGTDGVPGENGYTHIKYSNDGGLTFTENEFGEKDGETVGKWIGIYTDNEEKDSVYPTDYKWNKVVGEDGITYTTWIRYSNYPDGGQDENGADMTTNPEGMSYLGIAISSNGVPPRNPKSYSWSKITGDDGIDGDNGYLHIKYSDDGKTFTPNNGEDFGKYIGMYTDNTKEDSLIFSDYKWQRIVGEPGKGIADVKEYYLASSKKEGVLLEELGWTEEVQSTDSTKRYLWNYEETTYTDGVVHRSTPVVIGMYSEDGVGIESITNYYLATELDSGVTTSTPGWTTEIQAIDAKAKRYLWSYEVAVYTNGSTTTTDPSIIGVAGKDGYNGSDAIVGVLSNETHVVPSDEAGWVSDYTNIETTFKVFYGTHDDTANWTFSVPYQENMEGHLVGNTYKVDYVSNNGGGYARLKATRPGFPDIIKTFTLATSKKGEKSQSYWIVVDTQVLKEDRETGNLSPSPINITAMTQKGNGQPELYRGRISVSESYNGSSYGWSYVPTIDQSSVSYTPKKGIHSLMVMLNKAGTDPRNELNSDILDREVIMVVRDGSDGVTITDIKEYYLASSRGTGVTTGDIGWSEIMPKLSETNKYLWNYEKMFYNTGDSHTSTPAVIGTFSKDGVGISSVTEYYLVSELSSGVTRSTFGWSTSIPSPDSRYKYLWNYSVTNYTNGSSVPTDPVVIGVYGKDGVSMYVWIKYSDYFNGGVSNGSQMFDEPGDRKYMGVCNSSVYTTAPSNPSVYKWSKYKGEDGVDGVDGVDGIAILKVEVQYVLSSSPSYTTSNMWSTVAPEWKLGWYIWSRTKTTYDRGQPTYSSPANITGYHGSDGSDGSDGRSITSVVQQYYLSTSSTYQTGGSWIDNTPPKWVQYRYMWTRSKITYDKPPLTSYTDPVMSDVENRLGTAEINVNEALRQISLKASIGDIKSEIQINPEWVGILSNRIDLTGKVTFNSLDSGTKNKVNEGSSAKSTIDSLTDFTGTLIDGGKILTNSIQAKSLKVTDLSAISANIGTITSGSITGTTIHGNTITGGTLNVGDSSFEVDYLGNLEAGKGGFRVPWNANGVYNQFMSSDTYKFASRWKLDDSNYIYQDSNEIRFYSESISVVRFLNDVGRWSIRLGENGARIKSLSDNSTVQIRDGWDSDYGTLRAKDFTTAAGSIVPRTMSMSRTMEKNKSELDIVKETPIYDIPVSDTGMMRSTMSTNNDNSEFNKIITFVEGEIPKEIELIKDGESGISITNMTGVLWRAVQELSAKVDSLEKIIAEGNM